jgi:hypothetical protein
MRSKEGWEGGGYRQEPRPTVCVHSLPGLCVFPNHAMFQLQFPVNSSVCLANIRSLVLNVGGDTAADADL